MNRRWETKGELKLGKNIIISDPCYEPDIWCAKVVKNMVPGTYICKAQFSDEDGWGKRVSAIRITLKGCARKKPFKSKAFTNIGVDSGQCGFYDEDYFREIQSKRGKEASSGEESEWGRWWNRIFAATYCEGKGFLAGIVDDKCFVSSSGFGDGCYVCYVKEDEDGNIFDLWLKYI